MDGLLLFLLADDQEDIRALTAYLLERNGHTVISVADGVSALTAFQSRKVDVVLLDEEMPAMTGVQVLRAIRAQQNDGGERSFIIALTGNNTAEDCRRLLAEGFDAVLGKPFRMETLNTLINVAPEHFGARVEYTAARDSSLTEKTPLERVGGDEKLLRQMIRIFLRDSPKRMTSLARAIGKKDTRALSACAHALRGSLSIFTSDHSHELLNQIQLAARDQDCSAAARHYSAFKEEIADLEVNLRRYAKRPKVKLRARKH
jgi:CheY-like chemotaxis protein